MTKHGRGLWGSRKSATVHTSPRRGLDLVSVVGIFQYLLGGGPIDAMPCFLLVLLLRGQRRRVLTYQRLFPLLRPPQAQRLIDDGAARNSWVLLDKAVDLLQQSWIDRHANLVPALAGGGGHCVLLGVVPQVLLLIVPRAHVSTFEPALRGLVGAGGAVWQWQGSAGRGPLTWILHGRGVAAFRDRGRPQSRLRSIPRA